MKLWSKEIFNENKSHVRIRRTKKRRSTNELFMVFVCVKTTEQLDFIRAMRELKTQMILAGSKDYLDVCDNYRQECIMRA